MSERQTQDPFYALENTCGEYYAGPSRTLACLIVMNGETRRQWLWRNQRSAEYSTKFETISLRQMIVPFGSGKVMDVDIDDTIPVGVVRIRFEISRGMFIEHFWREVRIWAAEEQ